MTREQLSSLPVWVYRLAWSILTVGVAYLVGQRVKRMVSQWLTAWAAKTAWRWDDVLVDALRRGVPLWSLLIGCYLAIGLWTLPPPLLTTITRALYVLSWLSVTVVAAGLAGKLVALYGNQSQQALPVTSLTEHIAKTAIVVFGLLMILHGLGISITPLLTALGVGGLAVALALQDTLSNLFSGFYLTVARQIRIGDYIKLESGHEGYVEDIGWRSTQIRMLPNNMVLVPNNKLGGAIITNYNLPSKELAVPIEVGVAYDSDLALVERVTIEVGREVMRAVPGGVPAFEPILHWHTFGESSINATAILRATEFEAQALIKHEFIKRLHARYRQEGITIPYPIRTVLMKGA